MAFAGPIIGMPFSLEGFAFFLEAIFLGVYLYGWDRMRPSAHVFAGVIVALSGALSGAFVVPVNAWMNTPVGFASSMAPSSRSIPSRRCSILLQARRSCICCSPRVPRSGLVAVAGIHARLLLRIPDVDAQQTRRDRDHKRLHADNEALVITLASRSSAALARPAAGLCVFRGLCVEKSVTQISVTVPWGI